jgi:hypothetical protein
MANLSSSLGVKDTDNVKENIEYGAVRELSWFIISEEALVCL